MMVRLRLKTNQKNLKTEQLKIGLKKDAPKSHIEE